MEGLRSRTHDSLKNRSGPSQLVLKWRLGENAVRLCDTSELGRRAWMRQNIWPTGAITLLAVWLVSILLIGCDQSQPSASVATDEPALAAAGDLATEDESKTSRPAPDVDEQAVNSEGLVVLGDHSPGSSTPSSPELGSPGPGSTADQQPANAPPQVASSQLASSKNSVVKSKQLPTEANVVSKAELNQEIAPDWPQPQAVLFVSGQQHGYLEPCGCTGLDKQKGGLIRRDTLLNQLRERGWKLIPVDVGNQVRRIGRQPEIKFQSTVEAFKMMDYKAATLGVDDLQLSSVELIQAASSDELNPGAFICSNVSIIDPSFFPAYRIIEAGGRKIGVTAALEKKLASQIQSSDVEVSDPVESLKPVVAELQEQGCDFVVLLAHASIEESARLAQEVPGFDLVVTAGGFGEPTLKPEPIAGSEAVMVQVGTKGMYGGIVGIFDDDEMPIRYQKIAISAQFKDSKRMLKHFAEYQRRLKDTGFEGLGVMPVVHPTARKFAGSEACGDCHTSAFSKWEETPHYHATDSIVAANNDRGGIPRHFDPECVSCHATGWNPQDFYPYASGFLNPDTTAHLVGSGCENCHGPGQMHVDAEYGDIEADNDLLIKLRQQMVITLEQARDKCLECHDLDNSPDFHVEGAFDEYWEVVKHYGKD